MIFFVYCLLHVTIAKYEGKNYTYSNMYIYSVLILCTPMHVACITLKFEQAWFETMCNEIQKLWWLY